MIWLISLLIRDGKGDSRSLTVPVSTLDINSIIEARSNPFDFAQTLALYVDSIITGRVEKISITGSVDLPVGIKALPGANSDVQEVGVFQFSTANGYTKTVTVSSFDESLMIPGTSEIDLSEVDVINFFELLTKPEELVANWTVDPVDRRGESLVNLLSAIEGFNS